MMGPSERFRRRVDGLVTKISSFVVSSSKFKDTPLRNLAGNVVVVEDGLFNGDVGILVGGNEIRKIPFFIEKLIQEEEKDYVPTRGMENRGVFCFNEYFYYRNGEIRRRDGFIVTSRKIIMTDCGEAKETISIGECPKFLQPNLATLVENARFDILDECVKIKDMDPDFRKWLVIQSGWKGPTFAHKLISSVPLSPSEYAYLYFKIHRIPNWETYGERNPLDVIHEKLKGTRKLHWFLCSLKRNSVGYLSCEDLWETVFGKLEYGELMDCLMDDVFKDEKGIIQKHMEERLI